MWASLHLPPVSHEPPEHLHNTSRRQPSNPNLTFIWKSRFDAAASNLSFLTLKWCARDLRSDVDSYSQLWRSTISARWLHSFVWRWWRARAATLPRGAENEALGFSWTLKPLNAGRQRRLHFLRPCLHFCLSLNPTFLLWGILEKRAERGFSVLLMQPPTREQRIWDTLPLLAYFTTSDEECSSLFFPCLTGTPVEIFQFRHFYSRFF